MAKKRVHEIAKERGMSSKEVIATLQKAGLDVKVASSSVDADDAARAFNGGDAGKIARERAEEKQRRQAPRTAGGQGFAAPPTRPVQRPNVQRAGDPPAGEARTDGRGRGAGSRPNNQQQGGGRPGGGQGQQQGGTPGAGGQQGAGGGSPQRPTRGTPPGRSGSSGRRRVIIDSQAARRPSGPPPNQQQPPRRGRGRRRRTPWVEPDLTAPEEVKEDPITDIASGATVKEVAESLGLGASVVIKKLMELGEMATLTQTLTGEAVEVLADAFEKKVNIVSAADEVVEEEAYDDDEDALVDRPPV